MPLSQLKLFLNIIKQPILIFFWLYTVLVSYCYYNKWPKHLALKTTQSYFLMVLLYRYCWIKIKVLAEMVFSAKGFREINFLVSTDCPNSPVYGQVHHLQTQQQQIKTFSHCITLILSSFFPILLLKTLIIYTEFHQDNLPILKSTDKQS